MRNSSLTGRLGCFHGVVRFSTFKIGVRASLPDASRSDRNLVDHSGLSRWGRPPSVRVARTYRGTDIVIKGGVDMAKHLIASVVVKCHFDGCLIMEVGKPGSAARFTT